MTYMLLLNCALKLVEEIILYYDARSKKHQTIKGLRITGVWIISTNSAVKKVFDSLLYSDIVKYRMDVS